MTESSSFKIGLGSSILTTFIYSCTLAPFDVIKNTQISSIRNQGPIRTAIHLSRTSGVKVLWRGLGPALATQYSTNTIYYPLYEYLRPRFESNFGFMGPGFAALVCRSITVCMTLPLERLRTSIQGTGIGHFELFSTNGLKATLYRDLIFSFTFFMTMENLYKAVKEDYPTAGRTFSIIAGSSLAGFLTHPFDVIKTKVQTRYCCFDIYDKNTRKAFFDILKNEGSQGIFIGLQPRMTKIVIGLLLYISAYEYIKKKLTQAIETS